MQSSPHDDDPPPLTSKRENSTRARFSRGSSSLPDALSGGWIDSSPPALPPQVSEDDESINPSSNSPPISSDPTIWLRLNLEHSYWNPYVTLFLNGERGRLTLTAQLVTRGLRLLLGDLSVEQLAARLPSEGVEIEWWDDYLSPISTPTKQTLEVKAPIRSRLSAEELIMADQSQAHPASSMRRKKCSKPVSQ